MSAPINSHSEPATPASSSRQASVASLRAADPQEGVTVQELPPVDRGVRAWTFCFAGFILEMFVWGFSFSYGIFQDYYTSHPPFQTASRVSIAAVGTVALALEYGVAFFLSLLFARYPDYLRISMWAGVVMYFTSLFCSSFAKEVWQLILLQGVGVGLGGGLAYMPIIQLLPEWFSERRGLAAGLIFGGGGVAGFVFPFILNVLLEKVGPGWTLRIWAMGSTFIIAIACLAVRSRFPVPKFTSGQRRPRFIPPQLDFVKERLFLTFIFTTLVQGLSYFPVSLYITTFTRNVANQFTATVVLAVFNLSVVLGQIGLGHLTDRFPYPSVMFASSICSALAAFLFWGFASSAAYLYVFAVVFGALSGGFSATWMSASTECAGSKPEYTGMAFSGISFFKGVSAVVGPIIAGMLLEAGTGAELGHGFGRFGYGAVELFVGSCALVSGLGSIGVALARQRARA